MWPVQVTLPSCEWPLWCDYDLETWKIWQWWSSPVVVGLGLRFYAQDLFCGHSGSPDSLGNPNPGSQLGPWPRRPEHHLLHNYEEKQLNVDLISSRSSISCLFSAGDLSPLQLKQEDLPAVSGEPPPGTPSGSQFVKCGWQCWLACCP